MDPTAKTGVGGVSPPTRVAWIETQSGAVAQQVHVVATHAGGVELNLSTYIDPKLIEGRHPRGWRGLKHDPQAFAKHPLVVATHAGGVD